MGSVTLKWSDTRKCKYEFYHIAAHYSGVIMIAMASQIIGFSIICSTVCSGADQRKHQSSFSLTLMKIIHRWPVNYSHKEPVTRKMFPFDDVIIPSITLFGYAVSFRWWSLTNHWSALNSFYSRQRKTPSLCCPAFNVDETKIMWHFSQYEYLSSIATPASNDCFAEHCRQIKINATSLTTF